MHAIRFATRFYDDMNIALTNIIVVYVLFVNVLATHSDDNSVFSLINIAIAQTQSSSSSHSHLPGLFYNPLDPFHSLFPIRDIETSTILDKAGDAVSRSGNLPQPYLQISHTMTPDGACEMCQFIKYSPGPIGMAGVAYASAQPVDLNGAKRIVFFAKGELGGEQVAFVAMGKPSPNTSLSAGSSIFKNLNFAVISKNVTLTNDWTRYELSLSGSDQRDVTDLFGFVVSDVRNQSHPPNSINLYTLDDPNPRHIVFFLKGVTIDNNPAINPIPTVQLPRTTTTTTVS